MNKVQLQEAARKLFRDRAQVGAIARAVGVDPSTFWRARQDNPVWDECIDELVEEMRREAAPVAYDALLDVAKTGDTGSARVAAAKALLDRKEGAVAQTTKVLGDADNPVSLLLHIEADGVAPEKQEADSEEQGGNGKATKQGER